MAKRKWSKALMYLGPSKIDGIGCFADIPIRKGELVHVFRQDDSRWIPLNKANASPLKKWIKKFGIRQEGGYWAPVDFLRISTGWYMNHSETPNFSSDDGDVTYYANRDIEPGEELTIDYRRMDPRHDNLDRDVILPGRTRVKRRSGSAAPRLRSRKSPRPDGRAR